ncbi:adenine nucleotide alpha hydrolase [Rossellomorea vietnamensis]|uniref:Adenine nucleotide alpha hydrolase n=1 Tax=Rossellomorea vietnamensis TaxID=218284 RepID=A0A5D4NUA8_9BACI|nr:adenine nucleotide alpha hydrolase [Rossellomorea vietnamensis]TYS17933.1 adenine nucleotide alpha hydrolase [Rossellomorea vietnamensis]
MKKNICLSWSGGRDSMVMLDRLHYSPEWNPARLLTTLAEEEQRVMMHDIPLPLLKKQSEALNLPLLPVLMKQGAGNEEYEAGMSSALGSLSAQVIQAVAFGDIYLKDIRAYRESQMSQTQLEPVFPLWGDTTSNLSREFIEKGYKAILICVDESQLDPSFLGREYDEDLLRDLPSSVDPCGENGEFHTFVYDGPLFKKPVEFNKLETIKKFERFHYLHVE